MVQLVIVQLEPSDKYPAAPPYTELQWVMVQLVILQLERFHTENPPAPSSSRSSADNAPLPDTIIRSSGLIREPPPLTRWRLWSCTAAPPSTNSNRERCSPSMCAPVPVLRNVRLKPETRSCSPPSEKCAPSGSCKLSGAFVVRDASSCIRSPESEVVATKPGTSGGRGG